MGLSGLEVSVLKQSRYDSDFCFVSIVLVLGAGNIRLVIENWIKYGLLIRLPHSDISMQDYGWFGLAWLSIPFSLVVSFVVEYTMAKVATQSRNAKPDHLKKLANVEKVVNLTHLGHLVFLLTFSSYIVYNHVHHPLGKT